MKKTALLLAALATFLLIFSACAATPAVEETTSDQTTLTPVNGSDEAADEEVFAGTDSEQSTTEDTDESIFYVG